MFAGQWVQAAEFELISRTNLPAPTAPDGFPSGQPDLSADGRYTVFAHSAGNLLEGDTNGCSDVFLSDAQGSGLERISVNSAGQGGDSCSFQPQVSGDGRYVLFFSYASNLDASFPGQGLYLRDRQAGTTRRVDLDAAGNPLYAFVGALSRDGRYLALVHPQDGQVYRRELMPPSGPGAFEWVSFILDSIAVGIPFAEAGNSYNPYRSGLAISDDGRFIAWTSKADVPGYGGIGPSGDSDGTEDIFLRDMQDTNRDSMVVLASRAADGSNPPEPVCLSFASAFDCAFDTNFGGPLERQATRWLSGDGQKLAFGTTSTLLPSDTPRGGAATQQDIYFFDRSTGPAGLRLLSLPQGESFGFREFHAPTLQAVSGDGSRVAINFFNTLYEEGNYLGQVVAVQTAGGSSLVIGRTLSGFPFCCTIQGVSISHDGSWASFISSFRHTVDDLHQVTDVFRVDVGGTAQTLLTPPAQGFNVRAAADNDSHTYNTGRISSDGRWVLFYSAANNLVLDDDGQGEYYLLDRQTGAMQRVGIPRAASAETDCRFWADMTPDARYVVYTSCDDETGSGVSGYQVYRWDRQTGERLLVSRADGAGGDASDNTSYSGLVSNDGQKVVFLSYAGNLGLDGAPRTAFQIYLRDIEAGTTRRLSRATDGGPIASNPFNLHFSGDGSTVAFDTSGRVTSEDVDADVDVYALSVADGSARLVAGELAAVSNSVTGLSDDGERFSIMSYDTSTFQGRILLFHRSTGFLERVDLSSAGVPLSSASAGLFPGNLSDDGRYVVMEGSTFDFASGEGFQSGQIYVRDLTTRVTARITVVSGGQLANNFSYAPRLSPDGRWIVFTSQATNLITDPGNFALPDVFFTENPLFGGELTSDVDTLTPAAEQPSFEAAVSGNGGTVVFESLDPKLHVPCVRPGLTPQSPLCGSDGTSCPSVGPLYVFALQVAEGCVDLVSVDNAGQLIKMRGMGKGGSDPVVGKPSTSAQGGLVTFVAPNAAVGKLAGEGKQQAERRQKAGGYSVLMRNMLTGTTRMVGPGAGASDPVSGLPVGGARPQLAPGGRAVTYTALRNGNKPAVLLQGLDPDGNPVGAPQCVSCLSSTGSSDPNSFDQDIDGFASSASVSADGRTVVYQTTAKNAAPSNCNNGAGNTSVVMRNMLTGVRRTLSDPAAGGNCLGSAAKPRVDWSGTRVVFESTQPLQGGASGLRPEVFLYDLGSTSVQQVSVDGLGAQVDAGSGEPTISGDGKLIAFTSRARQGFGADLTGQPDATHVVVRELRRNVVRRLSKNVNGEDADGDSFRPSLSYGGDFVVFDSQATNLSRADSNGATSDVFLRVNPLVNEVVFDSGFE